MMANHNSAIGLGLNCNTEYKMAECCKVFDKSFDSKLTSSELDPSNQCNDEIIGARDQLAEQKSFNSCVPADVTNQRLAKLFMIYVENHPEYWDRPARFGMLNVWSQTWPCSTQGQ
ncbi:MAG: Rap1a/Tai family immunity protein [Rhodospirillaceae bacterium]